MNSLLPKFDDMALFVEVARAGNFTKACQRLGMANATLSRRVSAMEKRLGVRLFERSTRHVALTDAAQRYFERCSPLVDAARAAHDALGSRTVIVQGHVRVSMPVDLGTFMLGPALPDFLRNHPGITLDLDLSPRFADLRTEPFDLAFRMGPVRGEGLVARHLGAIEAALFASPAYLDLRGRPKSPADLAAHHCLHIGSARRGAVWRFSGAKQDHTVSVRGPVALNNMTLMRLLAEGGQGIAMLPQDLARQAVQAGSLEVVLPRFSSTGWAVYSVSTSRMHSAAARAMVEFFRMRFTDA